jgi:hypothetical protein
MGTPLRTSATPAQNLIAMRTWRTPRPSYRDALVTLCGYSEHSARTASPPAPLPPLKMRAPGRKELRAMVRKIGAGTRNAEQEAAASALARVSNLCPTGPRAIAEAGAISPLASMHSGEAACNGRTGHPRPSTAPHRHPPTGTGSRTGPIGRLWLFLAPSGAERRAWGG